MNRMEQLRKTLSPKEVALIITPINRRYFSEFPSSLGYLFVGQDLSVLYVDSRYAEAAEKQAKNCEVRLLKKLTDALKEIVTQSAAETYWVERDISLGEFERLQELSPIPVCGGTLSKSIRALRQIKSPWEVEQIVAAQKIAEEAFAQLLPRIQPGVSERELSLELDYAMRRLGAEDISFDTIVVSGEKSSMPHGVPGERTVQKGDFITFDFGAIVEGYHSDMTRTVAVGFVTDEMKAVYDIVLKAQQNCIAVLTEGLSCKAGDAVARNVIESAGYGEYFGHGTGHSVGLEIHEEPRLSPLCEEPLKAGVIMTVEPGIYLPGRFGVRIEDMVLIEPDGCRNLTTYPKELYIL